jgi:hypothetical protein
MNPLITKIKALDPRILLADGYDDCLVGVTLRGQEWVALYDASRIVDRGEVGIRHGLRGCHGVL